jgi:hypothetical protein
MGLGGGRRETDFLSKPKPVPWAASFLRLRHGKFLKLHKLYPILRIILSAEGLVPMELQ